MAILQQLTLEEAQRRNPAAGPKPITIEEYRRRQQEKRDQPDHPKKDVFQVKRKKKRAGKLVKLRREIANLHRLVTIAINKKEKRAFLNDINRLKEHYRTRNHGKDELQAE